MNQRPSYRLAMLPLLAAALASMGGSSLGPSRPAAPAPRPQGDDLPTANATGMPRYSHASTWRTWSHTTLDEVAHLASATRDVAAAIEKRNRKGQRRLSEQGVRA